MAKAGQLFYPLHELVHVDPLIGVHPANLTNHIGQPVVSCMGYSCYSIYIHMRTHTQKKLEIVYFQINKNNMKKKKN